MADVPQQFSYTFDAPECKPGHLINLPKNEWVPFQVRNVAESIGNKALDYKGLDPAYKGMHTVASVWYCEAAAEALPPIDPQIVAQWESQGYTVSWNRDVVLNFNLMLAEVDDKGNPIRVVPDNRVSFDNKANTMRMETVGLWNRIGVPYGDIPFTDPQTGEERMQKQFNVSGMVGGYFFGKIGEPYVSEDGRVTQKIVEFMSVQQWQSSNAAPQTPAAPVSVPAATVDETQAATPPPAQTQAAPAPNPAGQIAAPPAPPVTPPTSTGQGPAGDVFAKMLGQ